MRTEIEKLALLSALGGYVCNDMDDDLLKLWDELVEVEEAGDEGVAGEDGGLENRRVFATLAGRMPDGIAGDAEGAIWVSCFMKGEFLRVREGGEVTDRVSVGRRAVACQPRLPKHDAGRGPAARTFWAAPLRGAGSGPGGPFPARRASFTGEWTREPNWLFWRSGPSADEHQCCAS